jgi:hypothetical protein
MFAPARHGAAVCDGLGAGHIDRRHYRDRLSPMFMSRIEVLLSSVRSQPSGSSQSKSEAPLAWCGLNRDEAPLSAGAASRVMVASSVRGCVVAGGLVVSTSATKPATSIGSATIGTR